nr:hypothetical protein [Tanacetum cinerariifolium]
MRNIDPPDGPATVEMVNTTKESFDEDDLTKIQELLLDAEKPLYKGCPDFIKLSAIVKLLNLNGVDTYDTSTKENFNLRAIVLWTINDYLVLGTLCCYPYSGFKGYVVYGKDTHYVRLFASSKQSYARHRRYLPYNYPLRRQKKVFNGQQEFQLALNLLTEEQIYNENVCESLIKTLLNVPGKPKDGMNARLDLAELGIKPELFARQEEDKTTLPSAGYTLTNAEKDIFYETLSNIRVPQGYCSKNFSMVRLKDRKLIGLKSHDYHMLMQEFLPIAICSIMHPPT